MDWKLAARWLGEENTASELKRLKRAGWTIRHDLATSSKANIDHLAIGPSAFVLDSKNVKDSTVSVEGEALRVSRIDDPDSSYLLDRFPVRRQAARLETAIERRFGFRIEVQPVVVIWGEFKEQEALLDRLAVVHGARLVEWLETRRSMPLLDDQRELVAAWVKQFRAA
jgi:hypothetical protein